MVRPLAGSILQANHDGKAAFRLGGVGHAVGAGPAAAHQHVVLLALNVQLLTEANVLDLIRPAFDLHVVAFQRCREVRVVAGGEHAGRGGGEVVAGQAPVRRQRLRAADRAEMEVRVAQEVDGVGHRAGLQLRAGEPRRAGSGVQHQPDGEGLFRVGSMLVVQLDALPAVCGHLVAGSGGRGAGHRLAVNLRPSVRGYEAQERAVTALDILGLDVGAEACRSGWAAA